MRAVVVGTGKIGCGYLAPLFADAGWEVVLAARTAMLAVRALVGVATERFIGRRLRSLPAADDVAPVSA